MLIKDVLTEKRYEDYLRQKPNPLHARYAALTNDQFVSIYAYSTEEPINSYKDINTQLRERKIKPDTWKLVSEIHSAIDVIEKDESRAVYFRYITLGTKSDVDKIYETGFISVHDFFTSVSGKNTKVFPGSNVLIRIEPALTPTPAYIAPISKYPAEDEFLYQKGSNFLVLEVISLGDNNYEIHVKEWV